jgi:hypothetical protein
MSDTEGTDRDKGKRGGGSGKGGVIKIRLHPSKLKEVLENWHDLDAVQVVERLAEFFSDLPHRASANAEVSWTNLEGTAKSFGYAIMHHFLEFGRDLRDYMLDPTRKSNADKLRRKIGFVPTGILPAG